MAGYEAALTFYTKDSNPKEWAQTQIAIARVWRFLPTGDHAENIHKAIAKYEVALTVYTKDTHPYEWASVQIPLASAWMEIALRHLAPGDQTENLHKALSGYEAALSVYTKDANPREWAGALIGLASLWQSVATGDRAENLHKAVSGYEAALGVYTKKAYPMEWANTQYNLAIALEDSAASDRSANLRKAIAHGKAALTIRTAETFPNEHAATVKILESLRKTYETEGFGKEVPFDQIKPSE